MSHSGPPGRQRTASSLGSGGSRATLRVVGLVGRRFVELPLTIADSDAFDTLPLLHRDPFDRLLVVQALAHGLTLITTDDRVRQYPIPGAQLHRPRRRRHR